MSKAADAFRTISEVGAELEVPKHVLRFWEAKFPQIRPMKRGGGRRYYRPSDMELLRGIRHLLHAEGYTIKGVQKILREQGIDVVKRFGRDGEGDNPPAAEARPPERTPRSQPAPAPASAQTRAAPLDDRITPQGPRELVARMIVELEACRQLLTAGTTAPAPARPVKRRTARG